MPKDTTIHRILVIGSGPIVIGQACEFDYSGSQASRSLRNEGIEVTLPGVTPGTNFERFRARGGRLLMYTGTMDNGVQPAGITGFVDLFRLEWQALDRVVVAVRMEENGEELPLPPKDTISFGAMPLIQTAISQAAT